MKRILFAGLIALAADTGVVSAQVYVRAPFVRVQTGPGVFVQAPFVNIAVPPLAPVYVVPPPSIYVPPPPPIVAPRVEILPQPQPVVAPPPAPLQDPPPGLGPVAPTPPPPPPVPAAPVQAMTLDQFASTFKARAGSFDVDLINPITKQATKVHFTLPAGTPKRVIVNRDEVEFRYGLFQFVRIEFTANGAQVVTRLGR
jgi:hypothetical protein